MRRKISNERSWMVQPLFFFRRFHKLSFDQDYVYFSFLGSERKIGLDKIIEIRPGPFPIRIFMRNAYIVTIALLDKDKTRKIRFLSKGAHNFTGTVDGIPFLDLLHEAIRNKKRSEQAGR